MILSPNTLITLTFVEPPRWCRLFCSPFSFLFAVIAALLRFKIHPLYFYHLAKAKVQAAAHEVSLLKTESALNQVIKVQDRLVQALQTEVDLTTRARSAAQVHAPLNSQLPSLPLIDFTQFQYTYARRWVASDLCPR